MLMSIMGITLEEIDLNASLPINPTIIRIMRVLRITRGTETQTRAVAHKHNENMANESCNVSVLKLLKMATGMRALLDTVMQALPQVTRSSDAVESNTSFKAIAWFPDVMNCGRLVLFSDLCGLALPLSHMIYLHHRFPRMSVCVKSMTASTHEGVLMFRLIVDS